MRAVFKQVFADVELPSAAVWQREALTIWRGAEFREERYAAINLAGLRRQPRSRRSTRSRCTRR